MKAVTPTRILDTRTSLGGHPAPFNAGDPPYSLPVLGQGGVPAFGVDSVQLNVTVVAPQTATGGGYLTLFPSGRPQPPTSSINFAPGWTIANQVLVPVGADGAVAISCGVASGVRVVVDVNGWVPADLLAPAGPVVPLGTASPAAADSVKAGDILANAVRYITDTWWTTTAPGLLAVPLGPGGVDGSGNGDAVRRMSMAALGLSTSGLLGRPTDLDQAEQLIARVASQHFVNTPGGWGEHWQSTLWAGLLGRAAWFMWDQLADTIPRHVARVVEYEAGYAMRRKVHYLRNRAGTTITGTDTGAEEVAWQASPLQVAIAMLPDHPLRPLWQAHLAQFSLAAWARPVDCSSPVVVNGAPISAWIAGSNVEPDGTVVNHDRPAPDYATTLYDNLNAVPLLLQAGQPLPEALTALLGPVYAALTGFYDPTTGTVIYPEGSDWGLGQVLPFALADALALVYGFDNGQAAGWLDLHLDAVLAQQARHPDGHTYEPGEYLYPGGEEHTTQLASQLALALHVRDHHPVGFSDAPLWIG